MRCIGIISLLLVFLARGVIVSGITREPSPVPTLPPTRKPITHLPTHSPTFSPTHEPFCNASSSEINALYDFYVSMNGDDWDWKNSNGTYWDFTEPNPNPCYPTRWEGVTCSYSIDGLNRCFVTGLFLNSFNLVGSIPKSIGDLTALIDLELKENIINGSIPDSICELSQLQYLLLTRNQLTGVIPNCIGQLSLLSEFSIAGNHLTNTIPESIGNLTLMEIMYLDVNKLTGSIPEGICNLVNLQSLSLNDNNFTNTIPQFIGNLILLTNVNIENNHINGTIPYSIGNMTSMVNLFFGANDLTGSIPDSIGNLTNIQEFACGYNKLTGSIPSTLSLLKNALYIDLNNNKLSGTITWTIDFPSLSTLDLSSNYLSGPLPEMHLPRVNVLNLFRNSFQGQLPYSLCNCKLVELLLLNNNMFTGSALNCTFEVMTDYYLSYNSFTGHLPSNISTIEAEDIVVNNNYFTGTIPAFKIVLLQYIVNDNYFSESIPKGHGLLESLYVQNNLLSGSIPLSLANLQHLQYLDVSNNELTGSLPAGLFTNTSVLSSFTASSNCITGSIPAQLCNLNCTYLGLDGLSTASACRKPVFPGIKILTSYYAEKQISGGIPACLFNMPNLETLQLSGNSIDWSFPSDLVVSSRLKSISLSHNALVGTIPDQIQLKQWSNLDLSYNKLVGTINPDISLSPNSSLTLQVNRLSGVIPNSLLDLTSINILTGNLFGCNFERDSLPTNDKAFKTYECGSNSFNQASIIWMCCAFIGSCLIVLLFMRMKWTGLSEYLNNFNTFMKEFDAMNSSLYEFKCFLFTHRNATIYFTMLLLVVFLPLYGVLTDYFKTAQYQYAWTVSAAFLSGSTPAIILLVFYLLLILMFYAFYMQITLDTKDQVGPSLHYSLAATLLVVVVIDCVIISLVNGGYVAVILNYGADIVFVTQIATAFFKLLWNEYAVKGMVKLARKLHKKSIAFEQELEEEMPFVTFIVLFNTIIAPCLATAAVDSNCFYNIFVTPTAVKSSFLETTQACVEGLKEQCTNSTLSVTSIDISYDPPFIYSYQCTSSILTNYASMYVFMYIMVAFLKPLVLFVMIQQSSTIPSNSCLGILVNRSLGTLSQPFNEKLLLDHKVLFRKERFILRSLSKIAVLITFGVIFPPLAIVVCVALVVEVYVNLLVLGRFLVNASESLSYKQLKEQLSKECEGCVELLLIPLVRLVVPFASIFYGFFVFDIYGDAVGYKKAMWAPVLLGVFPILILTAISVKRYCEKKYTDKKLANPLQSNDVEMLSMHNALK